MRHTARNSKRRKFPFGCPLLFPDLRHVSLAFGADYGCCWVQLGGTIALAQVSAYLSEPATTRPNEGILRWEIIWAQYLSECYEFFMSPTQSNIQSVCQGERGLRDDLRAALPAGPALRRQRGGVGRGEPRAGAMPQGV